jgi:bifunctional ADP-heptose synthase (sugar kinase/adenylyltransferase)
LFYNISWAAMAELVTLNELSQVVDTDKEAGERVVFTNGCFDIIYTGM